MVPMYARKKSLIGSLISPKKGGAAMSSLRQWVLQGKKNKGKGRKGSAHTYIM